MVSRSFQRSETSFEYNPAFRAIKLSTYPEGKSSLSLCVHDQMLVKVAALP